MQSQAVYLYCAVVNFFETNPRYFHKLYICFSSPAPIAVSDASVLIASGALLIGRLNNVALVICFFHSSKTLSACEFHTIGRSPLFGAPTRNSWKDAWIASAIALEVNRSWETAELRILNSKKPSIDQSIVTTFQEWKVWVEVWCRVSSKRTFWHVYR